MEEKIEVKQTIIPISEPPPYHSLSPKIDSDNHKEYCEALDWALENRKDKDIKNIALTGPYGSGKSSILKTFKETTNNGRLKFLEISLATFKEEDFHIPNQDNKSTISKNQYNSSDTTTGTKLTDERTDQLRLIELSILQQILYREEYNKIPDSRFKKVRRLDPNELKKSTWLFFGSICIFYILFYQNKLFELFKANGYSFNINDLPIWLNYSIKGVLLTIFLIFLYSLIKRIISFSQRLTISKFNFHNLEIQVKENIDKSILNNHLDEIIYFFEATDYNVVIIEDLDRFEQTEIFTKLREINLLINNSKSIKRDVTFIYAVKDEMFKNKDRTKFFDFIIPIIPVINYSNSNEQLNRALSQFGYSVSPELVENVAYYIDDMRLLYNIINEFHIYFQKFKGGKFKDKLFAIIVYKNIYPEDFSSLSKNEGKLFDYLVSKKLTWVEDTIDELDKKIESLDREYQDIENTLPKNLEELKRIYLLEYLKRTPPFTSFRKGNANYSIEKMLNDENFESLINNEFLYIHGPYNTQQRFNFSFKDIENGIDPKNTYKTRKEKITDYTNGRLRNIQSLLEESKQRKREIRSIKIKDLLKDKQIQFSEKPDKHEQLIILLLRNGYIAEDYLNYISYFYPGSITENDHWYLMNVRNEIKTESSYKLDEYGNIIKKLSDSDFDRLYILNYGLVDFMLEKTKSYSSKKHLLFKQLANESSESIEFVKGYLKQGNQLEKFTSKLCTNWPRIWNYLTNSSSFSEEEITILQKLILNHAEIGDIKKISSTSGFQSELAQKTNALLLFNTRERMEKIVQSLGIHFTNLSFKGVSDESKNFIYQNDNYAINKHMLKLIISSFGNYNEEIFNINNYSAILDSKCEKLIAYVENNIEQYIDNVFLKLDDNNESLDGLIKLLNNPVISTKKKEQIILKTDTKIDLFSNLENPETLKDFLLISSKIEPKWSNVKFDYENGENTFSEALNSFLNLEQNCSQLSNELLSSKKSGYPEFRIAFLLNDQIDDNLYRNYIKVFPYIYNDLSFESISKSKVQSLVERQKITFNSINYGKLKLKFPNLHLDFSVKNISAFFDNYSDIANAVLEEDLNGLLENQKLSDSNKLKLIEKYEKDNHILKANTLTKIGKLSLKYPTLNLKTGTFKNLLLKSNLLQLQKVELYMRLQNLLDHDFINEFLISLGGEFIRLNEKGPMPSFNNKPVLVSFFEHLKDSGKVSKVKVKGDKIKVTTFRN